MLVSPGEICVVQRGLKFKVKLPDGPSRGYIQEASSVSFASKPLRLLSFPQ